MVKIKGYEDYMVDENGNVFSTKRRALIALKLFTTPTGYLSVGLSRTIAGKWEIKTFRVHRLIAEAFIENKHGKPEVNHKNGIRDDNRADNLEWVTHAENVRHSYKVLGRIPARNTGGPTMPVIQLTKELEFVAKHKSAGHASRNSRFSKSLINKCCIGRNKTHGGFIWMREGEYNALTPFRPSYNPEG